MHWNIAKMKTFQLFMTFQRLTKQNSIKFRF